MDRLSTEQSAMLKRMSDEYTLIEINRNEIPILQHLSEKGYSTGGIARQRTKCLNIPGRLIYNVKITEAGKQYLDQESHADTYLEQIQRQAEAQEDILNQLKEESDSRSRDDKKYFWLGVLTSGIVSILVTYGASILTSGIQYIQQLHP